MPASKAPQAPRPQPSNGASDPLVGETVGHYLVIEKLGEGGMGAVYKAKNLSLKRVVALKILPPHLIRQEPSAVARFEREAQAAAALDHPNIVSIFAVGQEGEHHFIEMEYVKGETVQDRLREAGRLSVAEATRIVIEAAEALAAAHARHIVHRDIKPANIMLAHSAGARSRAERVAHSTGASKGAGRGHSAGDLSRAEGGHSAGGPSRAEGGKAKVMDFGLAKDVKAAGQLTQTGQIMGTPHYMSPEQCEGRSLDGRSDIYSLAATYFHLLTGDVPYRGDSFPSILYQHTHGPIPDVRDKRPALPPTVQAIIAKGMAKSPLDRYTSAREMLTHLKGVLSQALADSSDQIAEPEGEEQPATPSLSVNPWEELRDAVRPLVQNRLILCVALAGALTTVMLLSFKWTHLNREDEETVNAAPALDEPETPVGRAEEQPILASPSTTQERSDEEQAMAKQLKQAAVAPTTPEPPSTDEPRSIPVAKEKPQPQRQDPVRAEKADLLLRITPKDAQVTVDGKPIELTENGEVAFARVTPGRHAIKVTKKGHAALEKVLDTPAAGVEATVHLAPVLPRVTVHMRSGRKIEGWLLSREPDMVAFTSGRGKMTVKATQYERVDIGEPDAMGESVLEVVSKADAAVAEAQGAGLISALPSGPIAAQVETFLEWWEMNEESLAKAEATYGKESPELRHLQERRAALKSQAAVLAGRVKSELASLNGRREGGSVSRRAKSQAAVPDASERIRMLESQLELLEPCLSKVKRRSRYRGRLPRPLREAFVIPEDDRDQHRNPVTMRKGRLYDRKTKLPYEVWLMVALMEFVLVPAGDFMMGSSLSPKKATRRYGLAPEAHVSELPQHPVRITQPLYMAKYEMTQGQWVAVMGSTPWAGIDRVREHKDSPAVCVLPEDCHELMTKLDAIGGPGFRLPTEAEWEYTCRAGTTSPYCFGDEPGELKHYAWYHDNTVLVGQDYAHAVGAKSPNAWGLYDMHGNAYEWCQDWFVQYPRTAQIDPRQSGATHRAFRGGGFSVRATSCRSTCRFGHGLAGGLCAWGLRPVRTSLWQSPAK